MDIVLGRPAGRASRQAHARSRLHLWTAALLATIAFSGFAPSYWMPLAGGTLALHPGFHVHGALFFAWTLHFVAQAALVASGRARLHRRLGRLGVGLAALMVVSGVAASVVGLQLQPPGPLSVAARSVAALGFSAMVLFSAFVTLGIANVHQPEYHRRLMVLASFSIIPAAVVRLMRFVPGTEQPERAMLGAVVVDLLLLAIVLLDRRATGRLHPVWIAGGAALVSMQCLRAVIARTEWWADFAAWLAATGSG